MLNTNISMCFIDTLGLEYTGDTLEHRGLGGSESALIYLTQELATLGFTITVYNKCEREGIFNGVTYIHRNKIREDETVYDIVVACRSVIPLIPGEYGLKVWKQFNRDLGPYEELVLRAKKRVLWMHDTFLEGEAYLEKLFVSGEIDEVFLLSDWHSHYISQSDHFHTPKRRFEQMKKRIFETRNGIKEFGATDIAAKDPDLFVFNSSVSKGMDNLVRGVWPRLKAKYPKIKLIVIGGYYTKAGPKGEPDLGEEQFRGLVDEFHGNFGITFTDVITQPEVAKILKRATFLIYPPHLPETYGISTIEALYYNVVPITSNFGALEETAIDNMSYKIDYEMEKTNRQFDQFVELASKAYEDKYQTQQKQQACNEIKPWLSWTGVALQWKQHFYNMLGDYMPIKEIEEVREISTNVNRIFGRRFINTEDRFEYFTKKAERPIVIISAMYNAEKYIAKCIKSVASQLYGNYTHIIVDDMSPDNSIKIARRTIAELDISIRTKFRVRVNSDRRNALWNQMTQLEKNEIPDNAIIVLLDGDDSLVNNPDIFNYINSLYTNKQTMTYGSCFSMADQIDLVAQPYPDKVIADKSFRGHKGFPWGIPYTHLRTFDYSLFKEIDLALLKGEDDQFFGPGGDGALLFALLEKSDDIKCVQRILVNYNDLSPLNDYKVNSKEQNSNQKEIIKQVKTEPHKIIIHNKLKKILIAIPTAKNIETETFKSIYNLIIPPQYTAHFQAFYGYNIAQVRNLMAYYGLNNHYDYILWVDSDIGFAPDTLEKMLKHEKDIVSGLYIQRKHGMHIVEAYEKGTNIPYQELKGKGLVEVQACGFGCVLTKVEALSKIPYPHFVYKSAILAKDSLSEDWYFCVNAKKFGVKTYVDTSILCEHHGNYIFKVE